MSTYFISRHPGARVWAAEHGIGGTWVEHLDPARIFPGDHVIGTLPVNLAAEVCRRGAFYWHLAMKLPQEERGKELSAEQMKAFEASLICYRVQEADGEFDPTPGLRKLAASPNSQVSINHESRKPTSEGDKFGSLATSESP